MSTSGPQFPGFTFLRPGPEPQLTPDPIPLVPPEQRDAPPPPPSARPVKVRPVPLPRPVTPPPPVAAPVPEPTPLPRAVPPAPAHDAPVPAPEPELSRDPLVPAPVAPPPVAPAPEPPAEPDPDSPYHITLAARDPWCFHVWWDVSLPLYQAAAASAADGTLHVRLCRANGSPQQTFPVREDEYSRFLPVGEPGSSLHAEIGTFDATGRFRTLGRSPSVTAPRDRATDDTSAHVVTVPPDAPLAETVDPLGPEGLAAIATPVPGPAAGAGTVEPDLSRFPEDPGAPAASEFESDSVLDTLLDFPATPLVPEPAATPVASSLDAVPARPGRPVHRLPAQALETLPLPPTPLLPGIAAVRPPESSPAAWGGASEQLASRGFFAHLNAEVILYGGTQPGSRLRIAGQSVPLAPDGTFRFHFLLPDGTFHVPVEFTSPDGAETRGALVSLLRVTERHGDVGQSPQPEHLAPPSAPPSA